eukprot:363488-Chlamydomonas_euryale.AAC.8
MSKKRCQHAAGSHMQQSRTTHEHLFHGNQPAPILCRQQLLSAATVCGHASAARVSSEARVSSSSSGAASLLRRHKEGWRRCLHHPYGSIRTHAGIRTRRPVRLIQRTAIKRKRAEADEGNGMHALRHAPDSARIAFEPHAAPPRSTHAETQFKRSRPGQHVQRHSSSAAVSWMWMACVLACLSLFAPVPSLVLGFLLPLPVLSLPIFPSFFTVVVLDAGYERDDIG